jgi:two-component system OmpR family response regulator
MLASGVLPMSGRILVVEDDGGTADYVTKGLREAGYTVEHVADGRDGLYLASSSEFDAVVMDRMLPGMDGLSVVKALRAAGVETPILILSALAQLDERVIGLKAGGDDYLTKPFGFSELQARIENLVRRRGGKSVETLLRCGDLVMDLLSRKVVRSGKALELLPREFKLLEYFLRNKDRVVTRTMLLEQVWDYRFDPHTSIIDTHISRLRKKLDEGFDQPLLHTLRGVGYRLSEAP